MDGMQCDAWLDPRCETAGDKRNKKTNSPDPKRTDGKIGRTQRRRVERRMEERD